MTKAFSALRGSCLPILLLICMSGFSSPEKLIQIHYQEVDLAVKKTFIYEDLTFWERDSDQIIEDSFEWRYENTKQFVFFESSFAPSVINSK